MPDPKDNAKAGGNVHPPEKEETPQQRELEDEARPGKGENQAGFLKEKDGEAGRNT